MNQIDIVQLQPWIALILGLLILAAPRILNYLVAAYLILIGVAGLMARYGGRPAESTFSRSGGLA